MLNKIGIIFLWCRKVYSTFLTTENRTLPSRVGLPFLIPFKGRALRLLPKAIFLFLIVSQANAIEAQDLAIIVNKANPAGELSLRDLSKIFKAEKQFWDGEKIHLLMREQGSWEKEIILKKVYQMSDEEAKKFWLGKMFRGEVTTFPAVFGSVTRIKSLVNNMPGAIGFIDSQAIDDSLKVIRIEGKLPGEPGYPLAEE